jgi:integrase
METHELKTALTDRAIKAMKPGAKSYDLHDAVVPGMTLNVLPSGLKRFVLLTRFPGAKHPTRRALGAYGALTLEAARAKARTWLTDIDRGIDPAERVEAERRARSRARATTFAAVVEDYIRVEVHGPGGEDRPRHRNARVLARDLRDVLVPLFGPRPITELTADEIMPAIELIGRIGTDRALVKLGARRKLRRPGRNGHPSPEQARQLFSFLKMVFGWAIDAGGYGLEHDPLARVRKARRLGSSVRRDRTLSDEELIALVLAIERLATPHRQLYGVLLHSGLRLNEVGKARWSEIAGDTWTVPASRMKGKTSGARQAREHLVPITSALRRLFASLPRGSASGFVFRGLKDGTPITAGTSYARRRLDAEMLAILRQRAQARGEDPSKVTMQPWRNHDIRRSCRSTLSRLGVRPEVAELVLAHARPGIVGVYDKWAFLEERREALEKWSAFLADLIRPQPISSTGRKRANVPA